MPDMTKTRGAVIATAFLRGVNSEERFTIDSVINAYCVSIATAQAERRAMMLHCGVVANAFKWRDVVSHYVRHTGTYL